MDSLCFDDNKEDNEGKSAEGFEDIFGDPEVLPRVGDEYQAEIPSLITAPFLSQLVKKTRHSEITVIKQEFSSLGLHIPLKWAHCKFDDSCGSGTSKSVTSEAGAIISENKHPEVQVELQTASHGEEKNVGGFSNFESSKSDEKGQLRGKYLLPGLLDDKCWTDIEYNSFLLGLYLFGKNLEFLKIFVGSKNMGDIFFFYYGKFLKSKEYCRWSECRKLRTKRCIYGQKIFTGCRQQELLSRLFSQVPGECQSTLVEISRKFGEGKMPFEEYVFSLKDAVGIDLLIAAVGIGKGKQDLSGTAVEPPKTNHTFSVRPEIPIGKACSSLTSAEIIKFLTGDFRLSKARSGDLFWEAVWPCLLAKGWHSEQPIDHVVSGSKQSLVFLVPGVKKFSRKKLVKGDHYFDSISDVLNKVASDPGLLHTESQATEGSVDRGKMQYKQDLEGVLNREEVHYVQSHGSKSNQDLTKITIVDTSMAHDMNQGKVRQKRSLPFKTTSISTISSCSSELEQDTSEESKDQVEQDNSSILIEDWVEQANDASCPIEDQVEQANSSYPVEDKVEQDVSTEDQVEQANSSKPIEEFSYKGLSIDLSDCTRIPDGLNTNKEVTCYKCHSDLHKDEYSRETNEHPFIQKMTSDCTTPCIVAMQKLRACNHGKFSHCTESISMDRKFDLNEPISPSNMYEASEGMILSMGLENLPFPSYLAKGSRNMSNEGSVIENHLVGEVSAETSETRMLIDLNFPQVSPELGLEMDMPSSTVRVVKLQNDNQCANTSSSTSEITQFNVTREFPDGNKEEQSLLVKRRQSTRNRPLTTKAWEALEYRFINSKRKRKNTECSDNSPKTKCVRVSNGTIISATCDNGIVDSVADTGAEEENVIQTYSCSIDLNRGSLIRG